MRMIRPVQSRHCFALLAPLKRPALVAEVHVTSHLTIALIQHLVLGAPLVELVMGVEVERERVLVE
jgi:hypothetical protein